MSEPAKLPTHKEFIETCVRQMDEYAQRIWEEVGGTGPVPKAKLFFGSTKTGFRTDEKPTYEELVGALDEALEILANEVPASAFECSTGPDADGGDANAAMLGAMLRRLQRVRERAFGIEGPASKVARALGESP